MAIIQNDVTAGVRSFSSLSDLVFPRRYSEPSQGKGVAGEWSNIRSLSSAGLLNHYILPTAFLGRIDEVWEAYRRMYGEKVLSRISAETLRDLLRFQIYMTGLVSAPDLSYLFGIDYDYLHKMLEVGVTKSHNLLLYRGEKINYTQRSYYMYCPDKEPFCSYPVDPVVDYADKTLSARSLPHTYSIGLTESCIRLYSVHRSCYRTDFYNELPLGNYRYTEPGKGKAGAAVVVDAFGITRDTRLSEKGKNLDIAKVFLIEQDMGTESLSVLVGKLVDYSGTDYFDARTTEKCCMVFSCHSLLSIKKMVPPNIPCPEGVDFVALFMFYAYRIGYLQHYDDMYALDHMDILPNLLDDTLYQDLDLSFGSGLFEILHKLFCEWSPFFGQFKVEEIAERIMKLPEQGAGLETILLTVMGVLDPLGRLNAEKLYLSEIIPVLPHLADKETLLRTIYNQELYRTASMRHKGFAGAILDNIYRRRRGRYAYEDMTPFFSPIYKGFQVCTTATALLTNQIPYILWDRDSEEIKAITASLRNCFGKYDLYHPLCRELDLSNGTIQQDSRYDDGFPFNLRFHNSYSYSTEHGGEGGRSYVCVEDLSMDTAAYVRAVLFARYYAGPYPVKLVLLVDSFWDAIYFFKTEMLDAKKMQVVSQSPRCIVKIYPSYTAINPRITLSLPVPENGKMDFGISEILFLKKNGSPDHPEKIFRIGSHGNVEFLKNMPTS